MKISVLGLGYIGLPTAIILAKAGFEVMGFDINKETIKTLNSGKIHIVENNLDELFQQVLKNGSFKASSELQNADVYIIAVPTPFKNQEEQKTADLSYVINATTLVAKILKPNDLVILESTVPPQTTALMTDILEKESGINRNDFYTAHCPERVLPGKILYELEHNDRIIGAERKESALKAKEIYDSFVKVGHNYITDDVTAEMAKLVENSFRDVNIAFANELSILCDELKIDVKELIELANKHPRVNILTPGVGVGGHCISVDPWFIVEQFPQKSRLIQTARQVNDYKPHYIAKKIEEVIGQDKKIKLGVLGLAYKPDIDDLRESPALELAKSLQKKGYLVSGCEPNVKNNEINGIKNLDLEEIIKEADLLIITLAHKEFIEHKKKIFTKKVYDCVGLN